MARVVLWLSHDLAATALDVASTTRSFDMSHIRFDGSGTATVHPEDFADPNDSGPVFKDLARSRAALRATIADASRDPARCLGRFVITETVERSSVGSLHLAWDGNEQRFVAVRTVDATGPLSRDAQRVLETTTMLRHPAILAPLPGGFGVAPDGRLFVATEIAPGRTLAPRKGEEDRSTRTVEQSVTLVRELARALAYAQGLGLVHGAIHPASVLVDGHDHPRLIDWGLADVESSWPAGRARLLGRLGRVGFRAPETVDGALGDPRSDVFGLGALLLRLVAAKLPSALTPEGDGHDPALPPTLDPVIRRCLEIDPQRRYPSASVLILDLDLFLQGKRPSACSISFAKRLGRCWRQVVAVAEASHRSVTGHLRPRKDATNAARQGTSTTATTATG